MSFENLKSITEQIKDLESEIQKDEISLNKKKEQLALLKKQSGQIPVPELKRSSEELTKEVFPDPTKIKYYLSTPNSDGSFNLSSTRESYTEGASMFAFESIGINKFNVYTEQRGNKFLLQYPDRSIDPVFDVISAFNPRAKTVQNIEPALYELENDRFTRIKKGKIDLDNARFNK